MRTRWTRRYAQRIRKRNVRPQCQKCRHLKSRKLMDTDWSFSGYLVKDVCDVCKTVTVIGPKEAVLTQSPMENCNFGSIVYTIIQEFRK